MPPALSLDLRSASSSLIAALAPLSLPATPALSLVEQWAHTSSPRAPASSLLDALASLLLQPQATPHVAVAFADVLPLILLRALDGVLASSATPAWGQPQTLAALHTVARLLGSFEELLPAASRLLSTPSLAGGPLAAGAELPSDSASLRALLLSHFRLLHSAPSLLASLATSWSSAPLHALLSSAKHSAATRLLALHVFAKMQRMPEAARLELQVRHVGQPSMRGAAEEDAGAGADADVEIRDESGALVETLDAWILPLAEMRRCNALGAAAKGAERAYHASPAEAESASDEALQISLADLSPYVVYIGGVLLLRASPAPSSISKPLSAPSFVETTALQPVLHSLAQRIGSRLPVLLSGPAACGKTSLLSHLCAQLRTDGAGGSASPPLLSLQLGDQSGIDAKALLGSFVSSATRPGTFEWAEGALTRALRLGLWVVLEDIDRASSDVLAVVKPLVEALSPAKRTGDRPSLDLGSRGKVVAGEGFALFATRAVAPSNNAAPAPATFLGHGHWSEVHMPSPSAVDVRSILEHTFPRLAGTRDASLARLIAAWEAVRRVSSGSVKNTASSSSSSANPSGTRRPVSLRDLVKWCRRVEALLHVGAASAPANAAPFENQVRQEEIFAEACDVFLGALSPPASMLASSTAQSSAAPLDASASGADQAYSAMVEALAASLHVSPERAWWALRGRTPELALLSSGTALPGEQASVPKLRVGRVEMERLPRGAAGGVVPVSRSFAMTRPAALLVERLAACVAQSEPVLMVGETGTGKTTLVQHLASLLARPLVALNLSQQTESADLLGAFKPLDPKLPATELHNEWSELFERTFSSRRNARFVDAERKAFGAGKWARLAGLWRESSRMAATRKRRSEAPPAEKTPPSDEHAQAEADRSQKKRRTATGSIEATQAQLQRDAALDAAWSAFAERAQRFETQHAAKRRNLVFAFVEGPLVRALRSGAWVLLDEVNLAAPETLDCLSALLQAPDSSVVLTERGDLEPVPRHPDFRLFACMNPATDVGKKDLPPSLRSRFTEIYVPSPAADREALVSIVDKYIGQLALGDRSAVMDVAEAYAGVRALVDRHELADGANQRPHFSIRTLSRALTFAADVAPTYGLRRALWEGFVMSFVLLLDEASAARVHEILQRRLLSRAKNARAAAAFVPPAPAGAAEGKWVQVGAFWLETGPLPIDAAEDYVLTPSVQAKLVGLGRAVITRRNPVLIQGPTSAGKTSAIEYLARRTGHRFVRINNHEHTDIQEYLGSYASDADSGRLVFHEGLLVRALRNGDWIVLDELNLAPTDVLEALNRLLDDNRELVIPETGEVVRPHPHFMLFATQNPPGLYAGRKMLSRAFRNRFLEIHFDDVPQPELELILTNRCQIAPSYAAKIVAVFVELQKRRQAGRVFDTKQAFVTLRDLFRWGQREAVGYQALAENGYMLIAERARRVDDRVVVREVIEQVMRVRLDESKLYDLRDAQNTAAAARIGEEIAAGLVGRAEASGIVWTDAMQRLLCLVAAALRYDEPVLLVGETGSGKTSVCELLASAFGCRLHAVNCHQNTDTADLLGGQRPLRNRAAVQSASRATALEVLHRLDSSCTLDVTCDLEAAAAALSRALTTWPEAEEAQRNGCSRADVQAALQAVNRAMALFEWHDGPLVEAMRQGDHLLLDEISLADDSVLERLNSVLEPGRTLVLAERSGASIDGTSALDAAQLKAQPGFQVLATMNPGGDYGKKELSPALRNRFTEIWVPHVDARADLLRILQARWATPELHCWSEPLLDFVDWITAEVGGREQANLGLRDILAWTAFVNAATASGALSAPDAFAQGALLAVVDGIGALPATAAMSATSIQALRRRCHEKIAQLVAPHIFDASAASLLDVQSSPTTFSVGPFAIAKVPQPDGAASVPFSFSAPTTAANAMRVLRALLVPTKAILLEGSPGAGKTSLVAALAAATGNALTRINLSDQTELVDLFGGDLPLEGGAAGEFEWRDAAFLRAMQSGEWVLLDEMNLASQTVLEGLNSCLDHRGSVYVPELGRSFSKHRDFRIFAAQNPQQQGGGRKGLPKSFLNRFTKVFVEELRAADIEIICAHLFPAFDRQALGRMIEFNARLHHATMVQHSFGRAGAPWEFNLRDLLRWLGLLHSNLGLNWRRAPMEHLANLYLQRFRTERDRVAAAGVFETVFGHAPAIAARPQPSITPGHVQFGHAVLQRLRQPLADSRRLLLLPEHLSALETLADCVQMNWLAILAGHGGAGKTSAVRLLAKLVGAHLEEFSMSSGVDTMDLLGTFEQADPQGVAWRCLSQLRASLEAILPAAWTSSPEHFACVTAATAELQSALAGLAASKDHVLDAESLLSAFARVNAAGLLDAAGAAAATELAEVLSAAPLASGRFEWRDGPLVRAMHSGSWLLIDDANLCSASVLDRLNSLFEPDGTIVLSERGVVDGAVPVIRPHPSFRVFMALDPRQGELSRAMRNRGIEIYLDAAAGSAFELAAAMIGQAHTNEAGVARELVVDDSVVSAALLQSSPCAQASESLDKEAGLVQVSAGLPRSSLALASRVTASLQEDSVSTLDNVREHPLMLTVDRSKALAAQRLLCSAAFLDEQGPDLRLNAAACDSSGEQTDIGLRVELLVRAVHRLAELSRTAHAAAGRTGDDLSVLDVSALTMAGHTLEHEAERVAQAGALFPLAVGIAVAIRDQIAEEGLDVPSLEHLGTLLDQTLYLVRSAASSTHFDYSSTQVAVRAISLLMQRLAEGGAKLGASVLAAVQALGGDVALKSGFAMQQIWTMCLPRVQDAAAADLSSQVERLLASAPRSALSSDLTKNAVDIAATLMLDSAAWSGAERSELFQLAQRTLGALKPLADQPHADGASSADHTHDNLALTALELSVQSAGQTRSAVHSTTIKRATALSQLLLASAVYPLEAAVAQRKLEWTLAASGASGPMPAPDLAWAHRMWASDSSSPADLFRPMMLRAAVATSLEGRTSLDGSIAHQAAAVRLASLSGVALLTTSPSRAEQVSRGLTVFVVQLTGALRDALLAAGASVEIVDALVDALNAEESAQSSTLQTLVSEVTQQLDAAMPDGEAEREILGQWCGALQQACVAIAPGRDLVALGTAWTRLAAATLQLYLPSVAVDPLATQRTHEALLDIERERIQARVDVARQVERSVTGTETSPFISSLLDALTRSTTRSSGAAQPGLSRQPDLAQLTALHKELSAFRRDVIATSKIEHLIGLLSQQTSEQSDAQEASLQATISSFRQRLHARYGSLQDLVNPYVLALDQLQLGLRTLHQGAVLAARTASSRNHARMLDALVSFPSSQATARYAQLDLPVRLKADSKMNPLAAPLLLAAVGSIATDVQSGVASSGLLRRLIRVYDQLYQLWVLDRERERRAKEQEASLYKSRRQDDLVQDETALEEEEFLQLFPEFGDVLHDAEANKPKQDSSASAAGTSLKKQHVQQLYRLHLQLFASHKSSARAQFETSRLDVLQRIMHLSYEVLPESLDRSSAALQIKLLAASATAERQPDAPRADFYTEADRQETSKAVPIVHRMRTRLDALIREWPDQMVLQHIRERCDAILRLDANSPVAKVLAALEGLLVHTEDWENFASSATSLSANRSELSAQLIEWRRLELDCWARLLQVQAERFEESVAEFWFQLFEVAIRGMQAAVAEGAATADEHVRKLIALLDQYVRSSTLGQYGARLDLLRSFSCFLDLLLASAPSEEMRGMDRIATVLANVCAFYGQLQHKVDDSMKRQRGVLEKEIRDFIKLASWKDVNIHALKQSALKTHRKLHRCIRKFRDVLRQPVDPLLAAAMDSAAGNAEAKTFVQLANGLHTRPSYANAEVFASAAAAITRAAEAPQHLLDLPRTLGALHKMLDSRLLPSLQLSATEGVDDLAGSIVSRASALAKATPAMANEENGKLIKQLLSRKRKAWTDLLRELRRIGLRSALKPEIVARQQDAAYVYTQRIPALEQCTSVSTRTRLMEAERYHHRLLAALPRLRESIRTRTDEIPVAELLRGIAFVEHGMSFAFAERARLASILEQAARLDRIVERLRLSQQPSAALSQCGEDSLASVEALGDALHRLSAALHEVANEAPTHLRLSVLKAGHDAAILTRTRELHGRVDALTVRVDALAKDMGSGASFLAPSERELVHECATLFDDVAAAMASAAVDEPALAALCQPVAAWSQQLGAVAVTRCLTALDSGAHDDIAAKQSDVDAQADRIISSVLVIAQDVRKSAESRPAHNADEEDLEDDAVLHATAQLAEAQRTLRLDTVLGEVSTLFTLITPHAGLDPATLSATLSRVSPFLAEYAALLDAHLGAAALWYRTMLKLVHVLCATVSSLVLKGFCKPPEDSGAADDAGGDGGEQLEGGTGLGDGSGAQDVTDQMQDDELMEELQKDDQADAEDGDKDETQREKGAREQQEDFGGELESVGGEDEGEGDEADEDKDDAEEPDLDEHVGDVDPLDPNTVDEKMWDGGDDEKEQQEGKDETQKDLGDEAGAEEDTVAKDRQQQQQQQKSKGQDKKQDAQQQEQGDEQAEAEDGAEPEAGSEGEEEQQEGMEEQEEDEGKPGLGRQLDEEAGEADNLDLNEDLQMDDESGGKDDDDDAFSDMSLGDDEQQQQQAEDQQQQGKELTPDREELEKLADQDGAPEPQEDAEGEVERNAGDEAASDEEQGGSADEGDDAEVDEALAEEQQGAAPQQNDALADSAPLDDGGEPPEGGDAEQGDSAMQEQSARAQQGRQTQAPQPTDDSAGQLEQSQADMQGERRPDTSMADAAAAPSGDRQEQSKDAMQEQPDAQADGSDTNPMRSLGDALRDFRRNLDAIEEAADADEERRTDDAKPDGEAMPETGEVEHVREGEDTDMQALGAARDEEQAQQLPQNGGVEDEELGTADQPPGEEHEAMLEVERALDAAQMPPMDAEAAPSEEQKALMPSDVRPQERRAAGSAAQQGEAPGLDETEQPDAAAREKQGDVLADEDEEMAPLPEDERLDAAAELETSLLALREADAEERAARAADLWRAYSALTADLSFGLCEQLRLILAPTLATRLNGDFRTGKRLNMRKIVPFIASDFAKDKIWLRRTKPSAREYQVLLAVDDSRSMAESHSAHLAYQTLALVSGALGRLEVGDVSICRFGQRVETLHPFGQGPLGDAQGAHVLEQLSFEQRGTDVLRLVEHSLATLEAAREQRAASASAAELWQLEIIISDGICQDHDRLRALLRKAAEQRVMLVFVIVDSLQQGVSKTAPGSGTSTPSAEASARNSILSMSSVSYTTNPATGKLELKMERYLDSFPFEYFVVVRDVDALPDVLAATLRQWAERIRDS